MTLKTRISATLSALVLAVGGSVAVATPAHAGSNDCLSGKLCLWNNIEYGGTLYMYNATTSCTNISAQNDQASSGYNRTSRRVRLCQHANCTGSSMEIFTGMLDADFRYEAQGLNMNDKVSSFKQI